MCTILLAFSASGTRSLLIHTKATEDNQNTYRIQWYRSQLLRWLSTCFISTAQQWNIISWWALKAISHFIILHRIGCVWMCEGKCEFSCLSLIKRVAFLRLFAQANHRHRFAGRTLISIIALVCVNIRRYVIIQFTLAQNLGSQT